MFRSEEKPLFVAMRLSEFANTFCAFSLSSVFKSDVFTDSGNGHSCAFATSPSEANTDNNNVLYFIFLISYILFLSQNDETSSQSAVYNLARNVIRCVSQEFGESPCEIVSVLWHAVSLV